jgi:hypothetical protein
MRATAFMISRPPTDCRRFGIPAWRIRGEHSRHVKAGAWPQANGIRFLRLKIAFDAKIFVQRNADLK